MTTSMTTSQSVPQQLMKEATRLAADFQAARKQIGTRTQEVYSLIKEQRTLATNERTRAIFAGIQDNYEQFGARGAGLVAGAQKLLQDYRQDDYVTKRQEIATILNLVDTEKLRDEARLAQVERAWKTIVGTPDAADVHIASVHIALYSQMFYFADALNALLGYPSTFRGALNRASVLVKALTIDVVGTVIPFFGTLTAIFELMEPRIERVITQMTQTGIVVDRLFQFDDQMTDLMGYSDWVEETTNLAERSLERVRESFTKDAIWLRSVLAN